MAPMTRCRATTDHTPTQLMATYYAQRSGAGLIITEGTGPTANGTGYARIPGIYRREQIEAWQSVTAAVHEAGGKIFLQLMHCGRVSHPLNMDAGTTILAPSSVRLDDKMHTDQQGEQPYPEPKAMSNAEIELAVTGFAEAAENALEAGFDGVEIHGANGYLIEQFLNPAINRRTDDYGGSESKRMRFALEVARAVTNRIGSDRTGIRLSPYGQFNGTKPDFKGVEAFFGDLAAELAKIGLLYVHIVDHGSMGSPEVPESIKLKVRRNFGSTIITSGGLDKQSAEAALSKNFVELAAFGRHYIANPDLVERFKNDWPLADPNAETFYTPGSEGYIDYSSYAGSGQRQAGS